LDLRGGLFVVKMFQDGPAYRGGIRPNDIIVKFNGTKVDSVAALRDALGKCQVGQQVPVTILRGDEEVNKTVTLTEMPQQSSRQ
ncbi:PDZ domain-containing protein, partial [Acidaminococcus fermentans]